MKKRAIISAIFFAATAHAQTPSVPALELEPATPPVPPPVTTPQPESIEVSDAAPELLVPAPIKPVKQAKSKKTADTSRATDTNDSIDGLKYPPARAAAEKSSRWANMANAMVAAGENGRVTVVYGESVPKIACAYLRVCSIELEAGETVNKVDAGDPIRWSITPSIVGEGASRTVYVVIKPKSDEPGLFTNVKIATNRRMYDIDIFSVSGDKFVRQINFSYPENEQRQWEAQRLAMAKEESVVTAEFPHVGVDRLNFNYDIDGNYPHRPVRVFDDSDKTYIQMSLDFKTQEAPVLVLIGHDGKEQLVNYRLKNGYFMVDKIFSKAALLVGVGGNQQKVVITRCNQRGFFGGCVSE